MLGEAREQALTAVNFNNCRPIYAVDDLNCGVLNNGVLPTYTDTDVGNNIIYNNYCFYYLCSKNITSTYLYPMTTSFGSLRMVGVRGVPLHLPRRQQYCRVLLQILCRTLRWGADLH